MSDDLVARLRHAWDERERQYDEDFEIAQVANALTGSPWISKVTQDANGRNVDGKIVDSDGFAVIYVESSTPERAVAEHIARHDPARVLAEVQRGRRDLATKRRILDQLSDAQSRRLYYDRDGEEPFVSEARATVEALQNVVRVLAAAEGLA